MREFIEKAKEGDFNENQKVYRSIFDWSISVHGFSFYRTALLRCRTAISLENVADPS